MLHAALALATPVVALLLSGFQELSATTNSTYPIAANGTLTVTTQSGDIKVQSWNGNTVKMTVNKHAQTQAVLDSLSVDVAITDGNVKVKAEHPHTCTDCDTSFDIQVPRSVNVRAHTASGNLNVAEIAGTADVGSESGNITVTDVRGAIDAGTESGEIRVEGPGASVHCKTSSGNITIKGARGDLDAQAASGNVSARVDEMTAIRAIDLRTTHGNVTLAMPRNAGATIAASTVAGSIDSDLGQTPSQGYAGATLAQTIGNGRVQIKLSTTAGNVELRAL
ncbi:MAG: DUF4097 family beta strand repeat protein [Candidatus Eremiobacteraeota bacterium]|nr:DUF4097 family beta strand repeat protein [Candidatus Eremiobacteraeota bacterium]MBV8222946.1 DUF4097 family beta strand repeat protein [Candidatus Eremiobacteraeota bacterium]